MTQLEENLFGIPLSTHRDRSLPLGAFQYEILIAAISIWMFRTTIPASSKEPWALRWFFALLLGYLTFSGMSYELIVAAEIFSYAAPICIYAQWPVGSTKSSGNAIFLRLVWLVVGALFSVAVSHFLMTGAFYSWLVLVTPNRIWKAIASIFPTEEMRAAYDVLDRFVSEPNLLDHQILRLFFVTFHIQCGIGYLGIAFLTEEQQRRNELVRMDMTRGDFGDDAEGDEKEIEKKVADATQEKRLKKSRKFQRTAGPFILFVAVPYMINIIAFGNLNAFAFTCFKDDIHRSVRLYELFEHDNHLVAVAEHSATSPEGKNFQGTKGFAAESSLYL